MAVNNPDLDDKRAAGIPRLPIWAQQYIEQS